jgi:hypothetical protein
MDGGIHLDGIPIEEIGPITPGAHGLERAFAERLVWSLQHVKVLDGDFVVRFLRWFAVGNVGEFLLRLVKM